MDQPTTVARSAIIYRKRHFVGRRTDQRLMTRVYPNLAQHLRETGLYQRSFELAGIRRRVKVQQDAIRDQGMTAESVPATPLIRS